MEISLEMILIAVVAVIMLADKLGVFSKLGLSIKNSGSIEPDAEPNQETPILDMLEKVADYAGFTSIKVSVKLIRDAIKRNPGRAKSILRDSLPSLMSEVHFRRITESNVVNENKSNVSYSDS